MSPRRSVRPPRRRAKVRPSTDAVQATHSQSELAADARHEGLAVTHRFDPGKDRRAVRRDDPFPGSTGGHRGKAAAGRHVLGRGAGRPRRARERAVFGDDPRLRSQPRRLDGHRRARPRTFQLLESASRARRSDTSPRALVMAALAAGDEAFAPVHTRWSPFVRLTAMPAVIHGSWTALVVLGIVIGVFALLSSSRSRGSPQDRH